MKGKKILFISSEVIPYMPQNEISSSTYMLPKLVNENEGQTRIFIPKYGTINERRHQLHEVIRLSGINLVINDMDMPLILKVASIPKERMQVYFIDSEDYFKGRLVDKDKNNNLYSDNDERAIFFAKGVIETIKKLNWIPDLIHVHGWIASLVPVYIKKYYNNDSLLENIKVLTSIYNTSVEGKMHKDFIKKILFDNINDESIEILKKSTYENLYNISILHSDAVIFVDKKSDYKESLDINNKVVVHANMDEYHDKCLDIYKRILEQ
tara:strand:+ start:464 stop:1264 length:801 start_codon:yes stop_codon:yes gene_type:complete